MFVLAASLISRKAAFSGSCSGGALKQRFGLMLTSPQVMVVPTTISNFTTLPVVLLSPSNKTVSPELAVPAEKMVANDRDKEAKLFSTV